MNIHSQDTAIQSQLSKLKTEGVATPQDLDQLQAALEHDIGGKVNLKIEKDGSVNVQRVLRG